MEVIELQNDLERLDRDWIAKQNAEGNVNPKTGTVSHQNTAGCLALGILLAIGGAGGLISSVLRSPFSWWHLLLSLLAVLLGPLAIRVGMDEISRLKDSTNRYQAIRASLVNRLNLLRRK